MLWGWVAADAHSPPCSALYALLLNRQKRTILCDSPNTDEDGKEVEDEEYDPQWQEDYDDDDDIDEDNFMIDNESDCDSYFDDDDSYHS